MHQTTREIVLDMIFDLRAAKMAGKKFRKYLTDDPYSRIIYKEEKQKIDIEGYLDNELLPGERKRFEKKLKENQELAIETHLRGKVNQAIKDIELVKSIAMAHDEYTRIYEAGADQVKSKESKTIQLYSKRRSHWMAAASVFILIGISSCLYLANREPLEKRLYSSFYEPLQENQSHSLLVNSSGLNEAKKKYQEKDYYDALIIFNNLPENINIQTEKDFYIALSLMEMNSCDEAIKIFTGIMNNKKFQYLPQTYWYLGLCYLNTNQKDKAIETFNHIVNNSEFNSVKAKKILRKLK